MFVQEYAQQLSEEIYGTHFNWEYYLGSFKRLCVDGIGTLFEVS